MYKAQQRMGTPVLHVNVYIVLSHVCGGYKHQVAHFGSVYYSCAKHCKCYKIMIQTIVNVQLNLIIWIYSHRTVAAKVYCVVCIKVPKSRAKEKCKGSKKKHDQHNILFYPVIFLL